MQNYYCIRILYTRLPEFPVVAASLTHESCNIIITIYMYKTSHQAISFNVSGVASSQINRETDAFQLNLL